jgi:hypothetical protein
MIIGIGIPFGRRRAGSAPAFQGLLDLYPNAAAGYSLRKLRAAYTGAAVRIRRSSDNAESDIGFLNNEFDIAAAQAFCGAGNGFVTTWYDQSGNGLDLLQTTAASQPQIVTGGVVVLDNTKPAISYNGTQLLFKSFGATKSQPQSIFAVTKNTSAAFGSTFGDNYQQGNRVGVGYYFIASSLGNVTVDTENANQIVTSFILNGANSKTRINNGTQLTGDAGTQTQAALAFGAGSYYGFMSGFAQEYIQWGSNQNANEAAIRGLINTYYNVY